MAAWMREEGKTMPPKNRQRGREVEEADKVAVAYGVTVGSSRRFKAALVGPPQGPPKRRQLRG